MHKLDLAVWERALAVNASGAMLGWKHAIRTWSRPGVARSSTRRRPTAWSVTGRSSYSASKGAPQAFTRNVATQYGKCGIRCNAVAPGIIVTELVEAFVPQAMKDS